MRNSIKWHLIKSNAQWAADVIGKWEICASKGVEAERRTPNSAVITGLLIHLAPEACSWLNRRGYGRGSHMNMEAFSIDLSIFRNMNPVNGLFNKIFPRNSPSFHLCMFA